MLLQTPRKRDAKLPDVPTIYELMDKEKTPATTRTLVGVILGSGGFGAYPIVASPGIPTDRVKILREAYSKTLKDPGFLEEAKKNRWELRPVAGEDLEALAREVAAQPPEVIEHMKKLLEK